MANHEEPKVAVVMVPLPAQGHLNQLLHLSNRLVSGHSLPVFYVGAATHIRQAKLRAHGLGPAAISNINFHEFPTPHFENPEADPNAPTKFPAQLVPSMSATVNLRDPVFKFVKNLSEIYTRVVVIYDSLMAYVVQDLDFVPNAEAYCFRCVSAICMYFFMWLEAGSPELPGEAGPVLKQIRGDAFFSPEFTEFIYLQHGSSQKTAGTIHNSNRLIEGLFLDLVAEAKKNEAGKQFVVGPFNPIVINDPYRIRHKTLDWLDGQEPGSTIFISFGTTSSITDEQIKELAIGLERSDQKFVWVLREADKGDIFAGEMRKPVLPEGFEERVRERGIVARDWVPQLEILGHSATGGFMSHCGWNSCMESISMGVPIATWPMHSDQPMNAVLLTKVLGIGVEVKDWGCLDEVVSSGVVESVVRKLMGSTEGDEMRRRAKELGVKVKDSMMEGGVSSKEMDLFITHITR